MLDELNDVEKEIENNETKVLPAPLELLPSSAPTVASPSVGDNLVVFLTDNDIEANTIKSAGGTAMTVGKDSTESSLMQVVESVKKTYENKTITFVASSKTSYRLNMFILNILRENRLHCHVLNVLDSASSDEPLSNIINQITVQQKLLFYVLKNSSVAKHRYRREEEKLLNLRETPVSTGFIELDNALGGGLVPGLYTLGGISSLGKTALIHQIADKIAKEGCPVLYFSLEMGEIDLQDRSISRLTYEIALKNYKGYGAKTFAQIRQTNQYSNYVPDELKIIQEAETEYSKYADKFYIYEGNGNVTVDIIRKVVTKYHEILRIQPVVIIDYIQLIRPSLANMSDKQKLDDIMPALKIFSRDFRVPVVAISSFNRTNYNSKANTSAFKESGIIEYSSDTVIALQLQGIGTDGFDFDEGMRAVPRFIEAVVLKSRNSRVGQKVKFEYHCEYNFFRVMSENENIQIPGVPTVCNKQINKDKKSSGTETIWL